MLRPQACSQSGSFRGVHRPAHPPGPQLPTRPRIERRQVDQPPPGEHPGDHTSGQGQRSPTPPVPPRKDGEHGQAGTPVREHLAQRPHHSLDHQPYRDEHHRRCSQCFGDFDQRPTEFGQYPHHDAQRGATSKHQGNQVRVHHRSPPALTEVIAVRVCSLRFSLLPGRGGCACPGGSAYPHYCSLLTRVDSAEADRLVARDSASAGTSVLRLMRACGITAPPPAR